ncbi:MAG: threonine/serine exporter family protein [Bacteroidales bacterium]|nr:threonine/serine exporter family protein [Bacteroidales bacterium]
MERKKEALVDVGEFIAEYSSYMMGCGIHTSRVIRSTKRIGEAYGYCVRISILPKSIIITLGNKDTHDYYSEVTEIPSLPISFEKNSLLSALSWETHDEHLSLNTLKEKFQEIVAIPPMNPWIVLVLASLANASFCRLFGGDWAGAGIVFVATLAGFFLRQRMTAKALNHYIVFITSAFVASLCASGSLFFNTNSDIILATSVLYLVPGVPLINGVIDIVEGHTLTGLSRLIQASLLIVCIAIGLSFTLLLVKDSLL